MSRYSFVSPGAMAGAGIDEVLDRQRQESRQQMLDALNAENTHSEMKYRDEQAQSMAEQRTATAAWRKSQADQNDANVASHKQWRGAIDAIDPNTIPKEYRDLFNIARQSPDDDLIKTLLGKMATPQNNGGDIFTTDKDGNPYDSGVWMPNGAQFHPQPKEPVGPKAAPFAPYFGDDNTPYGYSPDTNTFTPSKVPTATKIGPDGSVTSNPVKITGRVGTEPAPKPVKTPPLYTPAAFNALQASRKAGVSAESKAAAVSNFIGLISDPLVKRDINEIRNDPDYKNLSFDDLVSNNILFNDGSMDDQTYQDHLDKVRQVLTDIRGQ